jgi:acetyl-CoA C-acetyltransferase
VIGGCVSQVGEQSFDVARTAWLAARAFRWRSRRRRSTASAARASRPTTLGAGLVGAGIETWSSPAALEMMTRVPLGSNMQGGRPLPPSYREHYAFASQFQGAEMIAREYGITRRGRDRFGLRSQQLAATAWREGRFAREVLPIDAPVIGDDGQADRRDARIDRDEGIRETSLEKLAALKPVEPDGIHTAGTSSQVSDGAAAILVASPERARDLGLRRARPHPRARRWSASTR